MFVKGLYEVFLLAIYIYIYNMDLLFLVLHFYCFKHYDGGHSVFEVEELFLFIKQCVLHLSA